MTESSWSGLLDLLVGSDGTWIVNSFATHKSSIYFPSWSVFWLPHSVFFALKSPAMMALGFSLLISNISAFLVVLPGKYAELILIAIFLRGLLIQGLVAPRRLSFLGLCPFLYVLYPGTWYWIYGFSHVSCRSSISGLICATKACTSLRRLLSPFTFQLTICTIMLGWLESVLWQW